MDLKTKIILGILGAMGILNMIMDISFRLAIAKDVGASWYVWVIICCTVLLTLLSLGATYYYKRKQNESKEP